MSGAEDLFGEEHVRRYRETDGEVGHIWRRGSKILLLTTTGRNTREPRTTPLIYEAAADDYVIVASNGGAREERERLWELAALQWPAYDEYQEKTDREIPVVVLERI